jgi:hypothetical protein
MIGHGITLLLRHHIHVLVKLGICNISVGVAGMIDPEEIVVDGVERRRG